MTKVNRYHANPVDHSNKINNHQQPIVTVASAEIEIIVVPGAAGGRTAGASPELPAVLETPGPTGGRQFRRHGLEEEQGEEDHQEGHEEHGKHDFVVPAKWRKSNFSTSSSLSSLDEYTVLNN